MSLVEQFQGFDQANTTAVPDVFFDELLPTLSGAECKVMLYIIRRTLGFKKSTDAISFNQFKNGITTHDGRVLDKGCGVQDRTTLSKALASLEAKNCIETTKGKNEKKINEITAYSIKFRAQGSRENLPPVVGKTYQGSRKIPQGVVGKSYPQLDSNTTNSLTNDTYDADASLPHVFSPEEIRTAIAHASNMGISQGDITEGFIVEVIKLLTGKDPETDVTNQPELSTPIVDKSPEQVATSNPIANDTPQPTHNENGSQSELIARPAKPEMPPTSMKLSPLKLVLITEALIGEYYTQKQHPKQINAAKRILAEGVDEEQYIAAYSDIRNWWKEHNGTLNVVDMAANTPRKQMRALELVERVRTRGKPAPGKNLSLVPRSTSIAEDYSAIGEVEQRQMNEFYAAHPELLVGA